MHVKKTIIKLVVLAAVTLPFAASAQTSSINAFSPYSLYGIGELQTQGSLPTRSMGGAGVAMRSSTSVNLLNPAAYSATRQKSFLFNFGIEGQNFYNSQNNNGQLLKTSYSTFNFHDIAIQFPVAKGLGIGFSLTPYSSVGYRMSHTEQSEDIWGNIGRIEYKHLGDGDVTEVKLGIGWEVFKNLSIGVAAQYYWGDINRHYTTSILDNITGAGAYSNILGLDNYSISHIKGQVGIQWSAIKDTKNLRELTIGATYDIGGNLHPDVTKTIRMGDMFNTTVKGDTTHLELRLPSQIGTGIYYQDRKVAVGLDYVYQNWGAGNTRNEETISGFTIGYRNTSTVKLGIEYTPDRYSVRSFLKRWSYRVGFRYGGYHQTFGGTNISQYAVTAGIGIPIKLLGLSYIDLGVEYGSRGNRGLVPTSMGQQVGLIKQNYFKFSMGISMFGQDYWFVRPKYD